MREKWRPFRNGYYAVSNIGRVKRLKPGSKTYPGRILKIVSDKHGYMVVQVYSEGEQAILKVHQLVARAFLGPPPFERFAFEYNSNGDIVPTKFEVNHKDRNPKNNIVSNLEWLTHKQNIQHGLRNGVVHARFGEQNGNSKLTSKNVCRIRKMLSTHLYTQKQLGKLFGVSLPTIQAILYRRIWRKLKCH